MSSQNKSIFITGATGYVGRSVIELALAQGYKVRGLSRNEQGDAKLRALSATPVRGDLTTIDVLRQESAQADGVLHLAFIHDFTMDHDQVRAIDMAAVNALAEPLRGTNKALVITSATVMVDPDPSGAETTEDAPPSKSFVLGERIHCENNALRFKEEGVRVSAIRLPAYVYGRGGSSFVPMLMQAAVKAGESIYVDDGSLRSSGVHVDDGAAMFLLAMQKSKAGEVFNACSSIVTLKELAEAIGAVLELPVRSVSHEEAEAIWGHFLTAFVQFENRPSTRKAYEQLGWQPKEVDLLTDIRSGSYRDTAKKLRQG